jgi:hypothetical protein
VKVPVAEGKLSADRLENYLKLGREARSMELRRNEHLRRKIRKGVGAASRRGDASGAGSEANDGKMLDN